MIFHFLPPKKKRVHPIIEYLSLKIYCFKTLKESNIPARGKQRDAPGHKGHLTGTLNGSNIELKGKKKDDFYYYMIVFLQLNYVEALQASGWGSINPGALFRFAAHAPGSVCFTLSGCSES